eukprot:TRINITY_DN158_c2_g1_i1.p1 TRINITY_DN158_c2_g1~~TRINITY_DN158_c2_g1_i1.p1  ORF type:complete len:472 (+),score=180.64 TRINITY_DN158_c2_g1_i1:44-1459(+)
MSSSSSAPCSMPSASETTTTTTTPTVKLSNAALLKALIESGKDPATGDMIGLFDRYAFRNMWNATSFRQFFMDLQEANAYPRVCADEMLTGVISDLPVELKENTQLSLAVDFKTVSTWIMSVSTSNGTALLNLHDRLKTFFNPELEAKMTVIVSGLASTTTAEQLGGLFSTLPFVALMFARFADTSSTQAMVIFKDAESVQKAVEKSGTVLLSQKVVVIPYTNQDFPILPQSSPSSGHKPSWVARGLAPVLFFSKKAIANVQGHWQSADQKYGVSDKLKHAASTVSAKVQAIDSEYKISEKTSAAMHTVSDSVMNASRAVTNKVNELDKNYHVSENIKKTADKVMANKHVQEGITWISGIATKVTNQVTQTITGVETDTKQLLKEKESSSSSSSSSLSTLSTTATTSTSAPSTSTTTLPPSTSMASSPTIITEHAPVSSSSSTPTTTMATESIFSSPSSSSSSMSLAPASS